MSNLTKVATKSDLPPGKSLCVRISNKQIALFNIEGKIYAINDECSHAAGPLSEGEINGTIVTCPLHGATFDVSTGTALSEPAYEGVETYDVVVEGEDIKVQV